MKYKVTLISETYGLRDPKESEPTVTTETVDCDEVGGSQTDYLFLRRRNVATMDGKGAKQGATIVAMYPRSRVLKIELEEG